MPLKQKQQEASGQESPVGTPKTQAQFINPDKLVSEINQQTEALKKIISRINKKK